MKERLANISQRELKEILDYDSETGVFRWRVNRSNVKAGSVAGAKRGAGYRVIGIAGKTYLSHRLAWLYVYGSWPRDQIDHINGVKSDNRIANIREANTAENHQNMPRKKGNRSGVTGVHWDSVNGQWVAQIAVQGKRTTLGRFDAIDDAAQAYRDAKALVHTFHPTPRDDMHQSDGLRAVALALREVRPP